MKSSPKKADCSFSNAKAGLNPVEELARELRATEAHRKAITPEKLVAALSTITDFLRANSTTGGGRRLRQFVWSIWNDSHLISLFDLCHGLDAD